jgi:hypothetical protein
MADVPKILVHIVTGESIVYCDIKYVDAVIVHEEEMKQGSRGYLCGTYKDLWALHPNMRKEIMPLVIAEVGRRFPIKATFYPLKKEGKKLVPDGPPVTFDVTEQLLSQGPDYIGSLRDPGAPTKQLADKLPERKAHKGPFEVDVRSAAMEFLFAAESEMRRHQREEAARKAREDEAAARSKARWDEEQKKYQAYVAKHPEALPPGCALTAEQIEAAREKSRARSERGRLGALKAWETRRKKAKEGKQDEQIRSEERDEQQA